MFSAPRQQSIYNLKLITRPYRRTTSNSGRLGTSGHVSAPSTCNATQSQRVHWVGGVCTRIRQLTCALADRQTLEARTPSSHLWLRPCSSRLVTVVPQQKYARKTWVRVDRVVRSMGHPLGLP
jgi:hypothetical protein